MAKYKRTISVISLIIVLIFTGSYSDNLSPAGKSTEANTSSGVNDWIVSTPEEQGMDSGKLEEADVKMDSEHASIFSFLVIRHGKLVYEKYYNGMAMDIYAHVYSVTKSVTSALTGIALDKGFIKSVDQKLSEFFPEYFSSNTDPGKYEITIKNMLTMTAGVNSVDDDIETWHLCNDWFKYVIDGRLLEAPGTKFRYNTGISHLMGGIISKATKMSMKEFADKYLFGPMGITNYAWVADPNGNYGGGHLLYLTPRDMAKLGYLYLKGGSWKGKQLVPSSWVEESVKEHSDPGDGSKYGYYFWLQKLKDGVNNKEYQVYSAVGYGGQYITVVPELDLVTVITSNAAYQSSKGVLSLVSDYVIPSVNK